MPDSAAVEIAEILKVHHAKLTRTNRHLVYKFPDGRMFTCSSTPSDVHAVDQQLRDLKRILGLHGVRGVAGERRCRAVKPGREQTARITPSVNTAIFDAMRKAGLVEARLQDKVAALTLELTANRRANTRRRVQLSRQRHTRCWYCRFSKWLGAVVDRARVSWIGAAL